MTVYEPLKIGETVEIGSKAFSTADLPEGIVIRNNIGLATAEALDGKVVHRTPDPSIPLYETRATITPKGDLLLMFPEGKHYAHAGHTGKPESEYNKVNTMLSYRSTDKGETWQGPVAVLNIDYNQHGFIPLIPKGSSRIYCFGSQPIRSAIAERRGIHENVPIGFFYSDDDGHTWSNVTLIRPVNDPGYTGMSVTRMCETDRGTWLLGTHEGDWAFKPLKTWQYVLRSEDQGATWELLPGKRNEGWFAPGFDRMDEGRMVNLGNDKVLMMIRTPEGHIWATWSYDDGKTWAAPKPTTLVHPDAPPMVFQLSDGKTLACFHHNRHHDIDYSGLSGKKVEIMKDRSEIWVSLSYDEGHTWSEPGFLFATAAEADLVTPFRNYQCSYIDVVPDGENLHIIVPHRWQQVLHLRIAEKDIYTLLKANELSK